MGDCNSRAISVRRLRCQSPRLAAIVGDRSDVHILSRVFIVAAQSDAILCCPEGQGENALRGSAVEDWRFCDGPVFSAIRRMKHSGRWAAGTEPDIVFAEGRNAGAAG